MAGASGSATEHSKRHALRRESRPLHAERRVKRQAVRGVRAKKSQAGVTDSAPDQAEPSRTYRCIAQQVPRAGAGPLRLPGRAMSRRGRLRCRRHRADGRQRARYRPSGSPECAREPPEYGCSQPKACSDAAPSVSMPPPAAGQQEASVPAWGRAPPWAQQAPPASRGGLVPRAWGAGLGAGGLGAGGLGAGFGRRGLGLGGRLALRLCFRLGLGLGLLGGRFLAGALLRCHALLLARHSGLLGLLCLLGFRTSSTSWSSTSLSSP